MAAEQSSVAGVVSGVGAAPEMVVLRPRLVERIWGFTELPAFLEQPEPGKVIGEAWLTASECAVEGQPEVTLAELARRWPEAFGADDRGEFPLLVKFLFPREKLSVQVHPNDAEARVLGEPRGKTECWYVVSAEPGAELALGFKEVLTRAEIEAAIREGTLESKLRYVPVKAGDMVFVEAGTIHAIGPGMVVLETQQYSDMTFRLYDYGRPRPLHLEKGLAVTKSTTKAGIVPPVERDGFTRLIESPYFVIDRFRVEAGGVRGLGHGGEMQLLVALGEGASIRAEGAVWELPAGHAVLLTAGKREWTLAGSGAAEVVRILRGNA